MKKKRFRKTKRFFKILLLLIIGGIIYSFAFSTYENIKVDQNIKAFKERAKTEDMYEVVLDYSQYNTNKAHIRRYWPVPRETSFEQDNRNVFQDEDKNILGQAGDIFATRQSPFKNIPVFHQFMTFYYGGHAAIYDGTYFLEATGYPEDFNEFIEVVSNKGDDPNHGLSTTASRKSFHYWTKPTTNGDYHDIYYRSKYVGLRIKDIDDELINEMIVSAEEKIDNNRLYNFLFFLNMKYKYYCTDFVSRSYEDAYNRIKNEKSEYRSNGYAKNLNDDGFITSVNDLFWIRRGRQYNYRKLLLFRRH